MNRSLKLYEELGDKSGIAVNLGNIGNVYAGQQDYPKVLEYLTRALKIYGEINDKRGIARNLENIVGLYMDLGDLSKNRKGYEGVNTYDIGLTHFSKGIYMLEVKSAGDTRKNEGDYRVK
jgi:tetratricopeptide (TPR) repeat protein